MIQPGGRELPLAFFLIRGSVLIPHLVHPGFLTFREGVRTNTFVSHSQSSCKRQQ